MSFLGLPIPISQTQAVPQGPSARAPFRFALPAWDDPRMKAFFRRFEGERLADEMAKRRLLGTFRSALGAVRDLAGSVYGGYTTVQKLMIAASKENRPTGEEPELVPFLKEALFDTVTEHAKRTGIPENRAFAQLMLDGGVNEIGALHLAGIHAPLELLEIVLDTLPDGGVDERIAKLDKPYIYGQTVQDLGGGTLLHLAANYPLTNSASDRALQMLELICRGREPDMLAFDECGRSPIHIAVLGGAFAWLESFLNKLEERILSDPELGVRTARTLTWKPDGLSVVRELVLIGEFLKGEQELRRFASVMLRLFALASHDDASAAVLDTDYRTTLSSFEGAEEYCGFLARTMKKRVGKAPQMWEPIFWR